ncbi:hypothetical protein KUTeg_019696, partial [Tegillarca granosa]
MADVLKNKTVLSAVDRIYDYFAFSCQKIGKCCNARNPTPFTSAICDLSPIYCSVYGIYEPLGDRFKNLFRTGFLFVSELSTGKLKFEELDYPFKKAFEILDSFIKSKSIHDKCLSKVLKNGDKCTETNVTSALAEHLLSQLAPGQSYTIDNNYKNKPIYCKCGCTAEIKYGNTGIGHEKVWHGHLDILLTSHEGIVNKTAVVTVSDINKNKKPDIEPVTKKHKGGRKSNCSQISMLQKSIHPEFNNHMIPTIVISSTKIRILMYDAENDILLRSNAIDVFLDIPDEPPQLSPECIIILWMVLHYTIFCTGINTENLTIDLNKIKSGFTDSITDCDDIYRFLLKSGVETFPKIFKNKSFLKHVNCQSASNLFVIFRYGTLDVTLCIYTCGRYRLLSELKAKRTPPKR